MTFQQNQPQGLTTSCKDCVFAEKEDKTQIGCSLNRIEKFKERGVFVVEAEDLEENEFYVIESWCAAYREEPWLEGVEDIHAKVREEYQVRVGYLVIADEDSMTDYSIKLQKTLDSILAQSVSPSYMLMINKVPDKHVNVIQSTVKVADSIDFEYKITSMFEEGATDDEAIDEVFNKVKNGFYIVVKVGHELRSDLTEKLNQSVNEELLKVGYVDGYDGVNGRTTQAAIHKHLNGNTIKPLKEKLQEVSQFEEKSSLIYTWEDIDKLCTE